MSGFTVTYLNGTTRYTLAIPKKWTRAKGITFINGIVGANVFNVFGTLNTEIDNLVIRSSGDANNDANVPNSLSIKYAIGSPGVYLLNSAIVKYSACATVLGFQTTYNVTISNATIGNSTCLSTSAASGSGGIYTTLHTGDFIMNYVTLIGVSGPCVGLSAGLTLATSGNVNLMNCVFNSVSNLGTSGMGILSYTPTGVWGITLSNCSFTSNLSDGATFQINGAYLLSFYNCTFQSNTSPSKAGVYFIPASNVTSAAVTIEASQFSSNTGSDGLIYLTNIPLTPVTLTLQISYTVFNSNTATGSGTALFIDNKNSLSANSFLLQCSFSNNSANEGIINVAFLSGSLLLNGCTFSYNVGQTVGGISASQLPNSASNPSYLTIKNSRFVGNKGTSLIKMANPNGVTVLYSSNNTFTNNFMKVLVVDRSAITDSFSTYQGNSGSSFSITTSSSVNITNSTFMGGSDVVGGAIYLGSSSTVNCINCSFIGNKASTYGGAVYIEQSSVLTCSNSMFLRNFAGQRGAAVYLFGSPVNTSFQNTNFEENESGDSATIVSISSSMRFRNSYMARNNAPNVAGITAYFSNISFANVLFEDHYNLSSPFIYIAVESIISITDCQFQGIETASKGGVMYMFSSTLTVEGSTFESIRASSGAVLYADPETIFRFEDCTMWNVSATQLYGGVLYVNEGYGIVTSSLFQNFTNGAVVGKDMHSLVLSDIMFQDGNSSSGAGLYCTSCNAVAIKDCSFVNLTAQEGAAVYLSTSAQSPITSVNEFVNCEFQNLTGSLYGAVFITNLNSEFQNCTFTNCQAASPLSTDNGEGGALSLFCPDMSWGCTTTLSFCSFTDNYASYQGGSIYWQNSKPEISNSTFNGNSARYGPNIASFPISIHLTSIDGNSTTQQTQQYEGVLSAIASGQIAPSVVTASLYDHYGQVILVDNSSSASIISAISGTSIIGNASATAVRGIFTFQGFGIVAPPGNTTSVVMKTSAIQQSSASNSTIDNFRISVLMRDCEIGESHVGDQCVVCAAGKYSLDPTQNCQDCPSSAICYGNYTMVPRPGYWRTSMYSSTFLVCPYQDSCLGSPANPPFSLTGECAEGYFGNLCNGCISGFSRLNAAECGKCPTFVVNAIRTSGIAIAVLIALVIIVAASIRSAKVKKSFFSIYIKIMLNYLQLVMLTANFNLSWPTYVIELFNIQKTAGNVTDQVFSIDCFLGNSDADAQANAVRTKLVAIAFMPPALFLISLVFWVPFSVIRRKYSYLTGELVTTNVVFFFLVHPSIVKFMFDFFNCEQLDPGQYWMNSYLNIHCWDSTHIRYALCVAVPSIIIWGIGLPTLCLGFLIKYRGSLELMHMRLRLGFIYNGYEAKNFYWELVILYRKLLIISIAVFLTNISIYLQALTVMAVILIAVALQSKNKPYVVSDMNDLELRGIMVAGITIYSGLYYMSNSLDYTSEMAIFIIIVISNVYFIAHWLYRVIAASLSILLNRFPCLRRLCFKQGYRLKARIIPSTNPLSGASDGQKLDDSGIDVSNLSRVMLTQLEESEMLDVSGIKRIPGLQESIIQAPDNSVVCEESERGKEILKSVKFKSDG